MPGELSNIIAGRISNVFNLNGKNLTTDAACASSLAALDTAVKGLLLGDYDAVLAGGADHSMDPSVFIKFSKIGALSAKSLVHLMQKQMVLLWEKEQVLLYLNDYLMQFAIIIKFMR